MEKKELNGVKYSVICAPAIITKAEHNEQLDLLNEENKSNLIRVSFVYTDTESTLNDERIDNAIQLLLQSATQAPYTFVLDTSLLPMEDAETWLQNEVIAKRAKVLCTTIKADISEIAKATDYASEFEGVVRVKNENTLNVFSSMSRSYLGNVVDEENALNKIISQFSENVENGDFTPVKPTEEKPQQQQPQNNLRRR